MKVEPFTIVLHTRVTRATKKDIARFVKRYPDDFYNESHFVRAAVLRYVRQLKEANDYVKSPKRTK